MSRKLFWRIVRFTHPWLSLALTLWRMAGSSGTARYRAQIRFWLLYSRIDVANLLAITIDLIQPEYWV